MTLPCSVGVAGRLSSPSGTSAAALKAKFGLTAGFCGVAALRGMSHGGCGHLRSISWHRFSCSSPVGDFGGLCLPLGLLPWWGRCSAPGARPSTKGCASPGSSTLLNSKISRLWSGLWAGLVSCSSLFFSVICERNWCYFFIRRCFISAAFLYSRLETASCCNEVLQTGQLLLA